MQCVVVGCKKNASLKRLCSMHYSRKRRRGTFDLPEPASSRLLRKGLKRCSSCLAVKRATQFTRDKHTFTELSAYCKECNKKKARFRNRRDRAKRREKALVSEFGITQEEYDGMLLAQGGGCAICGKTPEQEGKALSVDHDHVTGRVRGLLCTPHNFGVGLFRDDPEMLRRASVYVKESALRSLTQESERLGGYGEIPSGEAAS